MQTESAPISNSLPISPHERWIFSRRFWWTCLAATPALLPLLIFFNYHVDFIWNDAWDMADLLVKSHQHTLRFADFWVFHNEHRMPIPYLIMFVLAKVTHWNTMAELLFGYAMVCVLSMLLANLLRISTRLSRLPLFSWFLINMLIFSPAQGENWGFGFAACQNFIPLPCIVAALILLSRRTPDWKTIGAAAVLIEIASLSLTVGLLGWLIVIPLLVCWPSAKHVRVWMIWIGLVLISLIVQFWGYQPYAIQAQYYSASIVNRIAFLFAFLGNPLIHSASTSTGLAMVLGALLLLLYSFFTYQTVVRRTGVDIKYIQNTLPWLILGAYAIGAAILGASGRAGSGVQQATAGRYITISTALLICLIGLASFPDTSIRWLRPGRAICSGLLLIALIIGALRSHSDFVGAVRSRRAGVAHLTFIDLVFEPYAQFLVGVDQHLREKADVLNGMGYIRPPLISNSNIGLIAAPEPDGDNSHGTIEGGNETAEGNLQIWGWSVLPAEHRVADLILITCDDEMNVPRLIATGQVGSRRVDVANSLGSEFQFCGWGASIAIGRLPTGSRLVRCWGYDGANQKAYLLPGLAIRTAEK